MPKDDESGLVEPDIIINGRALTFAECMSVRVAVGSFRISLSAESMRNALGQLARNYDHHLANVEQTMLRPADFELTRERDSPGTVSWGDKREKA